MKPNFKSQGKPTYKQAKQRKILVFPLSIIFRFI